MPTAPFTAGPHFQLENGLSIKQTGTYSSTRWSVHRQGFLSMFRTLISLAVLVSFAAPVWAQKPPAPKAVTSIAEADADYAVQGEYVGALSTDPAVGLQVIAMGDGKFDAVLYCGGLPGAGWDKQHKVKFSGQRDQNAVVLKSDKHTITLQNGYAALSMASGLAMGNLRKTQRVSPTMGLAAPNDATVLFDGTAHELLDAKVSPEGWLEIGATTAMPVRDFRLHVEFKTPYQPRDRGQNRGNSGVYIQRRYEVQVLDSFGLDGAFNEAGSLYRQQPPDLNMALPPLVWQTYDIWFTAARFDAEGKKTSNARITLWHNGVPVHDNREIIAKTGAGQAETDKPLPIHFQNHGNPVHFRNIWIVLGEQVHPAEQPAPTPAVASKVSDCVQQCYERCRRGLLARLFCR
jgi:hypothetical protein